jgi:DNA polymerase-3 subunit delta'
VPKVYFHPFTQRLIDVVSSDIPQGLLIHGPVGVGLTQVAEEIARRAGMTLHTVLPEKNEVVDREKGTINVDVVRRLYDMTKTKHSSGRLIAIDYAETMGIQAQNAFLKLLEEPNPSTHFILLCHDTSRLLPTIHSRVQNLDVRPITEAQSNKLLDDLRVDDSTKRTQLLFIAAGLPAALTTLATDSDAFAARVSIIQDARAFLQGSAYQRLQIALRYKDSRPDALTLLEDAMKLLERSVREGKTPALRSIDGLLKAHERITGNGNIRLQLSAVMV